MSDVLDRPVVIGALTKIAAEYAAAAHATTTRRAYASQWAQFAGWCARNGLAPFSGETTVAMQIADMARQGLSVSAIDLRLAAIQQEYRLNDVPLNMGDNAVASVRAGVTRTIGTAPRRKAAALSSADLRALLATRRPYRDPQGARDRLALLLGFGAALRRSEVVALAIGDMSVEANRGVRVTIRRSKTDKTGAGRDIYVASNPNDAEFCVCVALRRWMGHRTTAPDILDVPQAERASRPLLCGINRTGKLNGEALSDKTIVRIIKDAAEVAGFDAEAFSGHSLRRGMLTEAAERGADLKDLASFARHSKLQTTMGYVDEANRWLNNPSVAVFGGTA